MMLRALLLAVTTLLVAITGPGRAAAQSCTFTMPDLNFGDIDLTTNVAFTTTASFQASCTGIAGRTVRVCPNFGAGSGGVAAGGNPRYMLSGVNQLSYNIYRNTAMTNVWGSRFWGQPPTPPTVNVVLNAAGVGTRSFTARGRIPAGQTTKPAGVYQSSFSGGNTLIAYAYSTVGNCAAIGASNATQVPFTVRARNTGTCSVSATTLDFGKHGVLDSSVDAASQITVTCTTGAAYNIGLDGGTTGAVDPTQRKMSLGATRITYGIYRDALRTQPWGSTIGTNTATGTGTGAATIFSVYGRTPAQVTPAPGIYTDTIVVTVTY